MPDFAKSIEILHKDIIRLSDVCDKMTDRIESVHDKFSAKVEATSERLSLRIEELQKETSRDRGIAKGQMAVVSLLSALVTFLIGKFL